MTAVLKECLLMQTLAIVATRNVGLVSLSRVCSHTSVLCERIQSYALLQL